MYFIECFLVILGGLNLNVNVYKECEGNHCVYC